MVELASTIWADGPSSMPSQPQKSQIRAWGTWIEQIITAFTSNGGLIYSSLAALNADLAKAANSMAWVIGDPITENNGVYGKVGAPGAGSWTRRANLPFSFIVASDAGAGTPNAIQATTAIPVSGSALVWMNVAQTNTGSPVTVSFNGGSPLTLKSNTGSDIAPEGLVAGMIVLGIVSGSTFRLLSDQVSTAIVAQAQYWAELAQQAAESIQPTTLNYGSSPSADSAAAIAAMGAALGYVRFPAGSTLIGSDITVDWPIYVQDGGRMTTALGRFLTITNSITAPHQQIFDGPGSVILTNDTDSGENSRQVHASWFGAFPGPLVDQAPAIQRALNAVGNGRESVIDFDVGNYLISSAITTTRGAWIRCSGTRRTVFLVSADGFDVFTTGNTACKFTDLQFENINGKPGYPDLSVRTNGSYIRIAHDNCEVSNVFHHPANTAILIDNGGTNAKVKNVEGVYPPVLGAGTRMILCRASGARIKEIYCRFSVGGPASIVEVGTGSSATIITPLIEDVEWVGPSIGVLIHGDSITVARGNLREINYRGSAGNAPQAVKFLTSGTGSVFGFKASGLTISAVATAGITLHQNSSGEIKEILIDEVFDAGTTGNCIEFIQSAGSIHDVKVGSNIRTSRPNDLAESIATASGVYAISCAMRGRRRGKTTAFTVPYSGIDDGVTYHLQGASVTITLPNNVDGSSVLSFDISTSNGATLNAGAGTINGAGTKALAANQLYNVAMVRNAGNCQWMTQA